MEWVSERVTRAACLYTDALSAHTGEQPDGLVRGHDRVHVRRLVFERISQLLRSSTSMRRER
jgi:hypothetical protein